MCFYEEALAKMLKIANLGKKPCYVPKEVQLLLHVSPNRLQQLCDEYEPPNVQGRNTSGIESYRLGTHRRIPYHGLLEWLENNLDYNKTNGGV